MPMTSFSKFYFSAFWAAVLIVFNLSIATPVAAKSFFDYCVAPQSDAQRQTVLAVMIKMKVQDRPNEENCKFTAQLLKEKWFLNIYPDPFEPSRGPASDLSPIEDETQLKILSVAKNEIFDLKPISRLTTISQLNINYNPINDISVLRDFKYLEELHAAETRVRDLAPLAGLQRLNTLSLTRTGIDDISHLQGLKNMKALSLSDNKISDVTAIRNMALEYLYLSNNRISALNILAAKNSLVLLDVSTNALDFIEGLSELTRIDAINLADNNISSLNDLQNLKTLRWLDVRRNKIVDLKPLSGLKDLERLYVGGNAICELPGEVAELQNEHLNSKGKWIRLDISGLDDQPGCR